MNDGVFLERPQLRVNGTSEQIKIASRIRNVGSTDGTCKQRVAHKHMIGPVLNLNEQATTTERVPGRVEYTKANAPESVGFASLKGAVSNRWLWQRKAVAATGSLCEGLKEIIVRVKVPIHAVVFTKAGMNPLWSK